MDDKGDDLIQCLKEHQLCAAGRELLKSEMEPFNDAGNEGNAFGTPPPVTDSDVEDSRNINFVLAEDSEDDEEVEVEGV